MWTPDPSDSHVTAAELLQSGQIDDAVRLYTEALAADPEDPAACRGLARAALGLGLAEAAGELIERSFVRQADSAEGAMLAGLLAEGRGEPDDALERFARAAALDPESWETRYHHGRALAAGGRFEEAIPELEATAVRHAEASAVSYTLGIAHASLGRAGEAVTALTRAIEVDPFFLDAYLTVGDVLCAAGRPEEARDVLLQAQSIRPDAAAVYDKLAAVELKLGDLHAAVAALAEEARIDPANAEAHVSLVTFALAAQDVHTAAQAVDVFEDLHGDDWRAPWLRSKILDLADRPEEAAAALRRAHEVGPKEWQPLNDLGTLLNAGVAEPVDGADAVAVLAEAAALAPSEEPGPRFNLGLAYWNAGRREEAQTAWEETAAVNAEHPVAAQASAALAEMAIWDRQNRSTGVFQ